MEAINIELYNSLKSYYNHIFESGYIPQLISNKLLIYQFISDILTGPMSSLVDSKDYDIFYKALECLYNTVCISGQDKDCSSFINSDIYTDVLPECIS